MTHHSKSDSVRLTIELPKSTMFGEDLYPGIFQTLIRRYTAFAVCKLLAGQTIAGYKNLVSHSLRILFLVSKFAPTKII